MTMLMHPNERYRFIPAIAPYSAGVVATPGYEIVWFNFRRPRPLKDGAAVAAELAASEGCPRDAVCAFALRLPSPLDFDGFAEFNDHYRSVLMAEDILIEGPNPIARTNVVPALDAPETPVVHGFAIARSVEESPVPNQGAGRTFVVAGAAELRDGALDGDAIVRPGDVSEEGMRVKAEHVLGEMTDRLDALDVSWNDVTVLDVYTMQRMDSFIAELQAPMGSGAVQGFRRFYARPPVAGLDFELDVRGVVREYVIA